MVPWGQVTPGPGGCRGYAGHSVHESLGVFCVGWAVGARFWVSAYADAHVGARRHPRRHTPTPVRNRRR